jgi:hypothetical protein
LPVTSDYTFFTHEQVLRFQLTSPHPAWNPKAPAATLPGHFSIVSRFCSSSDGSFP